MLNNWNNWKKKKTKKKLFKNPNYNKTNNNNKKHKTVVYKELKLKMYIDLLLPKWQLRPSF